MPRLASRRRSAWFLSPYLAFCLSSGDHSTFLLICNFYHNQINHYSVLQRILRASFLPSFGNLGWRGELKCKLEKFQIVYEVMLLYPKTLYFSFHCNYIQKLLLRSQDTSRSGNSDPTDEVSGLKLVVFHSIACYKCSSSTKTGLYLKYIIILI